VAGTSAVGLTVLRTLVTIGVTNWASQNDSLFAGLIIDDKFQVGPGTTLLATNANLDWYWWTMLFPTTNGAAVNVDMIYPTDQRPYDIRSKRRTADLGRTSILALNNGSAAAKNINVTVRQLVALP
jgi:hypothetical protein